MSETVKAETASSVTFANKERNIEEPEQQRPKDAALVRAAAADDCFHHRGGGKKPLHPEEDGLPEWLLLFFIL